MKMWKATASILIVLAAVMESGCQGRSVGTDFIRTSCSATAYPTLCYSSLSTYATAIQQNPKLLANAALSLSLDTAVSTSADMLKLSHTAGMTPREVGAMQDCVEELAESVQQLRKSMAEMKRIKASNFQTTMSDVQTWVSAALTDEDTCMDGFDGKLMDGSVKTTVRRKIENVAHMTSNALSLINTYATLHA
ncbi:21 kDa protein-like [Salvia miltiorrhiza]|uniref:21 kDa protein-like n=1 Tax=Salvia miltiorrhiza TaxID=226208 RepID=UPI0025AC6B1C|nr:21 kDa protein-like [Salvia miltiorrhiza]